MIYVDLQEIPIHGSFSSVVPIRKGESGEDKYCVTTTSGERLFLRIGICEDSIKNHDMHKTAETLDITIARTVAFGLFSDGIHYFWLLTWLDGQSASDLLPTLDEKEQYRLGVKAGTLLRKIHSLPVPDGAESEHIRLRNSIDFFVREKSNRRSKKSRLYKNIVEYLESNLKLFDERPLVFLHGDFGLANLIVTPEGEIAPTDFHYNMRSYGDPCGEISNFSERGATTAYTSGQISGYFYGEIPDNFWMVYRYYEAFAALVILSTRKSQDWVNFLARWYEEQIEKPSSDIPAWYVSL